MGKEDERIDWNADEVDVLCLAAEMMQTEIKNLMRQKSFDIPARDAAVGNLSLLHQARSKLSGHAPSMQFNELAALYGALLLLRDTLKEHSGTGCGQPQDETAACLEIVEPMCVKFGTILKNNGIEAKSLFWEPKPKRKGSSGTGRASAEK